MAGEQIEISLPTNDELYRWICLGETPPDNRGFQPGQLEAARAYWDELKSFSERENLLEHEFEGDVSKNFHQRFWELYLPKAFDAAGMPLCRGKEGQPDFYFEKDGQKIWLEAVACGESQKQNAVPPSGGSFFSGVDASYINQSMRGLATAIDSKIKKWNDCYKKNIREKSAHFIIALNGWRALNGHIEIPTSTPLGLSTLPPPPIVRMLFGLTEQELQIDPKTGVSKGIQYVHAEKTKPLQPGGNGAPIAHFLKPKNCDIAGALYSAANIIKRGASPLENEFIFIQNPYAPPVFKIFAPLIRPGNAYGYKVSEKQEPGHGG